MSEKDFDELWGDLPGWFKVALVVATALSLILV